MLRCLIFEDDHLLVVNKPAGLNTHAPNPFAGEGLYDWLRHREPRWAKLAIIHRLDKETSGVLVFSKSSAANRSLTDQFTQRSVRKHYLLLTDRPVPRKQLRVTSSLARVGEKYASVSAPGQGEPAQTRFELKSQGLGEVISGLRVNRVEAVPLTGRTHQIRVHAAESGFPILGDVLYGGTPARRVFLHAARIGLKHPTSEMDVVFQAPEDFHEDPRLHLRSALIEPELTTAYRLVHGASDGRPGWYVDRVGEYLLSQSERPLDGSQRDELANWIKNLGLRGAYHKSLSHRLAKSDISLASPQLVLGETAPESFYVRENGVQFELSFTEGYSVGLFLDQRDNRRRLLTGQVAADFWLKPETHPTLLNAFAYTCGFSVTAARAGFQTTSVDLSKKYLEWGKRNFTVNGLDPSGHDFIYGDVFDWLKRFRKKGRTFDAVLLDPPTFSQSKISGVFRAQANYAHLVTEALPLLRPQGVLFASTNAAGWPAAEFVSRLEATVRAERRVLLKKHYCPQPPDFPISRSEPAYLKTIWLQVG